jgi:hypothetical protein
MADFDKTSALGPLVTPPDIPPDAILLMTAKIIGLSFAKATGNVTETEPDPAPEITICVSPHCILEPAGT